MDLAAAVTEQQQREARRDDLDRRDSEHGGMVSIPEMVAEQQRREAARDWRAYRPSVTLADLKRADDAEQLDVERIDVRRLLTDCRAAVKRFARLHRFGGIRRAETAGDILATDAAMILLDRASSGGGIDPKTGKRSAPIDLGGSGGLPLRRDWLKRVEDPARGAPRWSLSDRAWSALLSAVKEAARAPEIRAMAEAEETEQPTDDLDLAALVEQQQRETNAATRLPDSQAPEIVAETMSIPLDAARAIVSRAYPHATNRDHAEAWSMTEASVKVALSRGARIVRDRFPDPADLLDALDHAAETYRQTISAETALALLQWRDDLPELERARAEAEQQPTSARRVLAWLDHAEHAEHLALDLEHAETACADWRAIYGTPPMEKRALDLAAARRHQGRDHLDPERVAASVSRILKAEQRRARSSASAARSSHLGGKALTMTKQASSGARVACQTREQRIWTYGLTARDDRAARSTIG